MSRLFKQDSKYLVEEVIENGFANCRGERDIGLLMSALGHKISPEKRDTVEVSLRESISHLGVVGSETFGYDLTKIIDEYYEIKDSLETEELWLHHVINEIVESLYEDNNALTALQAIDDIDELDVMKSGEAVQNISKELKNEAMRYREIALIGLEEDIIDLLEITKRSE